MATTRDRAADGLGRPAVSGTVGRAEMIALTLPYPPSKNRLHRRVGQMTILSREARDYRLHASLCAISQLADADVDAEWPIVGPVSVSLTFFRPRKTGDLDGRIPWLLDCLQGVGYADDKQVIAIHAYRLEDKTNPRVEVVIERYVEVTA
ncbi:MAG TPA: RusA family crossover junction endodeoxyribonuclease [Chloroflexota bacterium]|nr:RusA family crossover junction endodeoxyribonuclease [Chloroflexota bacterium]